jgi:hypothetical protein
VQRPARREYLAAIYGRYRGASRRQKGQILDEFCRVTGYHRKYALRCLNAAPPGAAPRRRRRGKSTYGPATVQALRAIWEAAGYPWSRRLTALLPRWVPWARRRWDLSATVCAQLLRISARQVDRLLAAHKHRLKRHRYGGTKPGTLLKHHIAIKTTQWDVRVPGFTELDLVAHCGARGEGEFAHSLNVTDIHTTWVETRAVLGRGEHAVQEALEDIRRTLPFRLRGIDSDNGSEFINNHLVRYCHAHAIEFTRGRPYKKDDNAHIEQKNWTHVRKIVGYHRYESAAAVAALNALYTQDLRLLQNGFLPSVKLLRKERVGARLRRHYDRPRTPLERLQECPAADPAAVRQWLALRDQLDPFVLADRIERHVDRLVALAVRPARSAAPSPPTPPGRRPRFDYTFADPLRRPRRRPRRALASVTF